MFFPALVMIIVALLFGSAIGGAQLAKRIAWAAAMVAPAWLARSIGSLDIDLRLVTLVALVPICIWHGRLISSWSIVDALVLGLAIVGFFSLRQASVLVPSEILVVISTWLVPYFMGRLVIEKPRDAERLIPIACVVCVFLSLWAVVESITGVNPLNIVAGRGGSRIAEQNLRLGLRRAEGPLGHPIYFGMTIAMLFPWAAEGARRAWDKGLPSLFLATPLICGAGVFCTLSRGPMLVLIVSAITAFYFWKPAWRLPIAFSAVVGVVLLIVCWPFVVDGLQGMTGEGTGQTVMIDGKEYKYSGTHHRTLLYVAYADALAESGWLGHGKWGSRPEHALYLEPHLRRTFRSIDNHYVLIVLNWGLLGLAFFLAFGFAALGVSTYASFAAGPDHRVLIGSMTGTVAAVMLLLFTVWFSSGFGFCWLSSLGMLVSLSKSFAPNFQSNFQSLGNPTPNNELSLGFDTVERPALGS